MNSFDMAQFIAPKSDQLNTDDLIAGPLTIVVNRVSGNEGSPEQPVNVFFENDDNKPYRPCKSMRRVMVAVWGADASKYVGKAMTLYRDPGVLFGGMKVGGIRISHMSDIPADKMDGNGRVQMSLTTTRAKRSPYTVQVLEGKPQAPAQDSDAAQGWADKFVRAISTADSGDKIETLAGKHSAKLTDLETKRPDLFKSCTAALETARSKFAKAVGADELEDDGFE